MTRFVPAHVRAAIQRDCQDLVTVDGVPAVVALGMVVEMVKCPSCGFRMVAGEVCTMCDLMDGE